MLFSHPVESALCEVGARPPSLPGPYLSEVVQGLVQVGMHARGRLVGDFDGVLQDALGDDMALGGGRGLCTDEDPELRVAAGTELLQLLLQGAQPLGNQVDILVRRVDPPNTGVCLVLVAVNIGKQLEGGPDLSFKYIACSMSVGIPVLGTSWHPAVEPLPLLSCLSSTVFSNWTQHQNPLEGLLKQRFLDTSPPCLPLSPEFPIQWV